MSNKPLTEMFEKSQRREDQARSLFAAVKAGERQAQKLVYRGHRCVHVLAEVYPLPEGVLVHQPVYTLTDEVNAEHSNEAGRANNTLDGNNTWKEQIYFLEQGYPNLQCDHIRDYRLSPENIKQHLAEGKRKVTI